MAKFADVTYGTKGNSERYTYVVNDNVRTGDYLQPSVKHYISGKIFGTTAIVQKLVKETSKKGVEKKAELGSKGITAVDVKTGKELGIKAERGESGRFVGNKAALGKTEKVNGTFQAVQPHEFQRTKYIEEVRAKNVELRNQNDGNETFDSYSSRFNKEDT